MATGIRPIVLLLLAAAIAAPVGAGAEIEMCSVLSDPHGDVAHGFLSAAGGQKDAPGAADLLELRFGSDSDSIAIELVVADLWGGAPAPPGRQLWYAQWDDDGGGRHFLYISRDRDRPFSATYTAPASSGPVPVTADFDSGILRVVVPRPTHSGSEHLEDIIASATDEDLPSFGNWVDYAPVPGEQGSQYFVGAECGSQSPRCPLLRDTRGDASLAGFWLTTTLLPEEPSVDIVTAGVTSDPDSISFSARVVDLSMPVTGFQGTAIDLFWRLRGDMWSVRALVSPSGAASFAYGPARDLSLRTLIETTGSLDLSRSAVRIDVPRQGIGRPSNGEVLTSVSAQAWAWRATASGSLELVPYDRTQLGRYEIGTQCGA